MPLFARDPFATFDENIIRQPSNHEEVLRELDAVENYFFLDFENTKNVDLYKTDYIGK